MRGWLINKSSEKKPSLRPSRIYTRPSLRARNATTRRLKHKWGYAREGALEKRHAAARRLELVSRVALEVTDFDGRPGRIAGAGGAVEGVVGGADFVGAEGGAAARELGGGGRGRGGGRRQWDAGAGGSQDGAVGAEYGADGGAGICEGRRGGGVG